MKSMTLTVPVRNSMLSLSDQQLQAVNRFCEKLESVKIRLERPGSVRSLQANAYYWGPCLTTISRHTGIPTEDLHVVFRDKFLPRRFVKIGSIEKEITKTTTDLTPTEFADYIRQVVAFAGTELGLIIPENNP